jgi:hypothetical protein
MTSRDMSGSALGVSSYALIQTLNRVGGGVTLLTIPPVGFVRELSLPSKSALPGAPKTKGVTPRVTPVADHH